MFQIISRTKEFHLLLQDLFTSIPMMRKLFKF
jgi:hypothetical protein